MNSPKTTGADDAKRMQHNVELFLSSELGHSLKRSVKLLVREQRSDFQHNRTTPLSEVIWVFLWLLLVSICIWIWCLPEASFQSEWRYTKSFGNYVHVSYYLWMWRAPPSWLRGCKPLFHTLFNLSLVQSQRLSAIIDFLFNWSRWITRSLIPKVWEYVYEHNIEKSVVF